MKYLYTAIALSLFSVWSLADDTEIYGTAGNTATNSAKPNVMFIMDTSGSMDVTVINRPIYDNDVDYSLNETDNYSTTNVFTGLNRNTNQGVLFSRFRTDQSTDCVPAVTSLETIGKVNGVFQANGDGSISCNGGNNIWLYSANYMNWYHKSGVDSGFNRLQTVVNVVKNITNTISDVNMGLMRFDQGNGGNDEGYGGGYVDVAIENITSSKSKIQNKLDIYNHLGGTPLTEVMFEAARYFRGEAPMFGTNSTPDESVDESITGGKYVSPITAQCQKNHIILFTDGLPSVDGEVNDEIQGLIGDMDFDGFPNLDKNCSGNGGCLNELTHWLYQSDNSTEFIDDQRIITYTIGGFDLDEATTLLNSAAVHGGGSFYQANNTEGLTQVLTDIFTEILAVDTTFTAPAVSVNAFNASEHRDDLYYALFRPENKVKWGGNLKRYKLQHGEIKGFAFGSGNSTTKVASNVIDPDTGYFFLNSFDLWNNTNIPDGKNVTNGGMANILPLHSSRKIFSNHINDVMGDFNDVASHTSFNMTATDFNTTFIKDWVRGRDVLNFDGDVDGDTTDARNSIGDPLHSEPIVVNYGGTDENPDSTIYFGTNEGFIHAVGTESGVEQFAFIPYELHDIQNTYFTNATAVTNKPYGMDGPISTWFKDVNGNSLLYDTAGQLDTGEHVYLYAGMRRGGRSYYALNVTDRNDPKVLFRITGGETTDFDRLGQTWSKMTTAKVKWNDESRFVLFFTGGYDTNQDTNNNREDDTVGNAIYMVDASTGELLWTASKDGADLNIADMKNSMPASLTAVDNSGDKHINYLFAADTGGRIFRIDINQENTTAGNFAKGGMIAQVGGNTAENNRRFYNRPNISLVKDVQLGDYLTISIGSGYRAHPLNTVNEDRFYVIKDRSPYSAPADYATTIEEAISSKVTVTNGETIDNDLLYNATSITNTGIISNDLRKLLAYGSGFYIEMGESEKVLSESTTFASSIFFSTFSPVSTDAANSNSCGANTGTSRVYAISQRSGMPVLDLDGDGDLDASTTLVHSGIAPRPVIIHGPGGKKTVTIGTETIEDSRFGGSGGHETDAGGGGGGDNGDCSSGNNNCFVTPVYWRQNNNN
jgi:type IV pilus assembly protein PilY1